MHVKVRSTVLTQPTSTPNLENRPLLSHNVREQLTESTPTLSSGHARLKLAQ